MHTYTEILILGQLLSGEKYGYEIKKSLQEVFGEEFEMNNNLLYPALRRFLEMGAIRKKVVSRQGKPNRHVYVMTERGEEVFTEIIQQFPKKLAGRQFEFLVRVALFDRLAADIRLEILRFRQEVLEKKLTYYQQVEDAHTNPYVIKVIAFQKSQVEQELVWIDELKEDIDMNIIAK